MKKVRIGIIGIGNMGSSYVRELSKGSVPNAELRAVCDINPERLEWAKDSLGEKVSLYDNPDKFFSEADIDAVIVATPHYDHPPLAVKGFEKGLHVLIDKPAGVYTKQVREMNRVAEKSGKVFGIMYNQRTNPLYQKLRDLIKSGELESFAEPIG